MIKMDDRGNALSFRSLGFAVRLGGGNLLALTVPTTDFMTLATASCE
jgi:hypothetical protein